MLLSQPVDVPPSDELWSDALRSVGILLLETVILGRLLLVGLLEERNFVLARNIRQACLRAKPGGSVVAVLAADTTFVVPKPHIAAALAPGTPHYRGALAVPAGFAALHRLGGMAAVHAHAMALAAELARRLRGLVHGDGGQAVR